MAASGAGRDIIAKMIMINDRAVFEGCWNTGVLQKKPM